MKNLNVKMTTTVLGLVVTVLMIIIGVGGVYGQEDTLSNWTYSYSIQPRDASQEYMVREFIYSSISECPGVQPGNNCYQTVDTSETFLWSIDGFTNKDTEVVVVKMVYNLNSGDIVSAVDFTMDLTVMPILSKPIPPAIHEPTIDINNDDNTVTIYFILTGYDYDSGVSTRIKFDEKITFTYDNTSGLFENTVRENAINITSFNKEITIKSSDYKNVDVQVYNMNGQLIETLSNIEIGYTDTKVNMSHIVDGIYILHLRDNQTNNVERFKISLQRE